MKSSGRLIGTDSTDDRPHKLYELTDGADGTTLASLERPHFQKSLVNGDEMCAAASILI
jgi:hypothetical protein